MFVYILRLQKAARLCLCALGSPSVPPPHRSPLLVTLSNVPHLYLVGHAPSLPPWVLKQKGQVCCFLTKNQNAAST